MSLGAVSAGPARPVEVGVGVPGHVGVDDEVDVPRVDPARRQVGGEEDAAAELLQTVDGE